MRREIKLLLFVEFLIAIGLGMLGPYYAIYVEKIAHDTSVVGYSYAAFWITVGLLSPLFGKLADKKSKSIFLLIGGSLSFIVSLLYGIVSSVYQLIIVEIFNGIATACFSPAYRAITAEITSKKNRGFEYGLLDSISYITYGLAAILATFVFTYLGATALFIFSGSFQLASSILLTKKISLIKSR
ncbi:MAG: MFS transporter [Candidatus Aenigmarchaeota archaeon]|nr:MFS transporter [Candidatus Aenigmarchaeota archaeon]MBU5689042.1 MFS transporter [Candidatus Aenigmarchaeota archaeon]